MIENKQCTIKTDGFKIITRQVDVINKQIKKNIETKNKQIEELKKEIKQIRDCIDKAKNIEKKFLES
tara:strand:- start:75 stop:275 length:201 start_codon:yes stop_codon:yes gene_type:complete